MTCTSLFDVHKTEKGVVVRKTPAIILAGLYHYMYAVCWSLLRLSAFQTYNYNDAEVISDSNYMLGFNAQDR